MPPSEPTPTRATLTAMALTGLALMESLRLVTGVMAFSLMGVACFLAFLPLGNDRLHLRERYLIAVAFCVAVIAVVRLSEPVPLLVEGLTRASYLAAFFLLLTVLRDGAMTSSSVLEVGRFLTRQPPGRRYWAIATGGHLMGVVMNFGALILLAPLVQRGAKDNSLPAEIVTIREQRQLSALARGFSWFIAWAPTSIAQVVAVAVVTGASPLRVAVCGFAAAVLVVIAGWIEDRAFGSAVRRRLGGPQPPGPVMEPPADAFRRLGTIYLALVALSGGFAVWFETALVNGIMLASLPMTVIWIAMQRRAGRGDDRAFSDRMRDLMLRSLPAASPEAATLALAGFTGTVLAGIVPPSAIASVFEAVGTPALIYIGLTAIVVLASTVGMPPMLTVTFLGSAASRTQGLDLDPDLLALALVLGWAINLTGSPFGATNLILARYTGVPVARLAYRWNGVFSLVSFGICAGILAILA